MKSNTKKRLIAFMLCMVLVLSSATSAFADELDTQAQDQTTTMADEPVATSNIINLRLDITHLYYPAKNSFQKGRLKRREIFTELLLYTLTT